ncbi:spermatogenesis-associated protein 13-like [Limulus polyphemus]|uniref:Spermatogenesis-associated protein 13-like n=1 Tax=Limulus polyphemus TaxID=6850 RepID=A0ABM1BP39_LIMPO|nr:spermatogenesis-associated protein 13-like [Limulus polyphemus]
MGIDSNHVGPNVNSITTDMADPIQLTSKTLLSPKKKSMALSRLKKNQLISKSERQLKTYSVPQFEAHSSEDVRQGEFSQHRPWSQMYCDDETQEVLDNSFRVSCDTTSDKKLWYNYSDGFQQPSVSGGEKSASSTFSHHSSNRTSSPRSLGSDSVLQKFRKTFSLRFQKNKKDASVSGIPSTNVEQNDSSDDSLSRMTLSGESDRGSLSQEGITDFRDNPEHSKKSPQKTSEINKCRKDDEVTVSSRIGSMVLRPSKERKKSTERQNRHSLKLSNVSTFGSPKHSKVSLSQAEMKTFKSINPQHRWSVDVSHDGFHPPPSSTNIGKQHSNPHSFKTRPVKSRPQVQCHNPTLHMRRSFSQPLDIQRVAGVKRSQEISRGLSDRDGSYDGSTASSDEVGSDSEVLRSLPVSKTENCIKLFHQSSITFAEALWDHVTVDPEELSFKAGEVIEVSDSSDEDWWWGSINNQSGWFPATFVRLRVNQEDTLEDCVEKLATGDLTGDSRGRMNISLLTKEQVRANIVQEIISTEKDFVKHLEDVVQGYLRQVRRRPDMFSPERITTIFGNIEEIYKFQKEFLRRLEACIDHNRPHLSLVGNCFLHHACRLLQQMIDISMDGFLLTPVQRICKYPLQLAELLKYTDIDHPDYIPVTSALSAMKEVAQLVNERKRRMECLERLVEWQQTIDGWEGPDVLDFCSVLIHSGDVVRAFSGWSREYTLFLFDHLLVYCKKDLLKRQNYIYKGRIHLSSCCIFNVEDGKDVQFGITVKNAWKIFCASRGKWFMFYTKTPEEKTRWLEAFGEERQRVMEDETQGFTVTERAKKAARLAFLNKQKAKRPKVKQMKGPNPHPGTVMTEMLSDAPMTFKSRTSSLPSNFQPNMMVMMGSRLSSPKKKGSGWFHFGSGKKTKK